MAAVPNSAAVFFSLRPKTGSAKEFVGFVSAKMDENVSCFSFSLRDLPLPGSKCGFYVVVRVFRRSFARSPSLSPFISSLSLARARALSLSLSLSLHTHMHTTYVLTYTSQTH